MPSARSNSSTGGKPKNVENGTAKRQGKKPIGSRFANIRSPDHWLRYPNVIPGVITAVTTKMNNPELRRKVESCLTDVMNNQSSVLAAYQTHFEKKDKNMITPRNYHKTARQLLVNYLGEEEEDVDQRLHPYLSNTTTFDQLKSIVDTLKTAKDPANNIMAPKRRFGLEESDDEEYEEQPPFKKRDLQTTRSYSNSRASFQKSTSVQRKNKKEKDLSQEEDVIPARGQSLSSSNGSVNHGTLVPFTNGNTSSEDTSMDLCPLGPYEHQQSQNAFLNMRQHILTIQRRQVLLTAPNRKPRKFSGTVEELREELRKVLDGNYGGDLNDMVEVLFKHVLMTYRMARVLQRTKIPLDLLMASIGFCGRVISLNDIEITDIDDE